MLVSVDGSIVLIPSVFRPANLGVHRNPRSPFHIHIFLQFPAESGYLDAHRGSWQRFHPQSRQLLSPSGEVVKLFIITKLVVTVDEHDCEVLEWNTAIDRLRQAADNGVLSQPPKTTCGDRSLALCWSSGCRRLSAAPVFCIFLLTNLLAVRSSGLERKPAIKHHGVYNYTDCEKRWMWKTMQR